MIVIIVIGPWPAHTLGGSARLARASLGGSGTRAVQWPPGGHWKALGGIIIIIMIII